MVSQNVPGIEPAEAKFLLPQLFSILLESIDSNFTVPDVIFETPLFSKLGWSRSFDLRGLMAQSSLLRWLILGIDATLFQKSLFQKDSHLDSWIERSFGLNAKQIGDIIGVNDQDKRKIIHHWHEYGFPRFCFSVRGIHIISVRNMECRFAECYANERCYREADGFCSHHTKEKWWVIEQGNYMVNNESDFCKTARFYQEKANHSSFTEAELEDLLSNFWKKMKVNKPHDSHSLKTALEHFGYAAISDVANGGAHRLRNTFREFAKMQHPDRGGCSEDYQKLVDEYTVLKSFLGSENK